AERADHLAITLAGPDAHAESGPRDQQVEADRDSDANADDGQPTEPVARATRQRHRAWQERRYIGLERERAVEPARAFREDQDQREGRHRLIEMVALVERADDEDFHHRAGGRTCREAGGEAEPERAGRA